LPVKRPCPYLSDTLGIPSITLEPIVASLEQNGLLASTETEELVPGRDTARIVLSDVLAVVRGFGETGSISEPRWSSAIEDLGNKLDTAVASTVDDTTLAELLDQPKH
jgi:DNA-binding IscR family transcriptional regulator